MIHDKETVLAGKKILVVDDDMRNVFSVKKVLEDKGIKILIGKNGKEGLTCLNDNPDIHLVLMDIMMPEIDGFKVFERLQEMEELRDSKVIFVTAATDEAILDRARNSNAYALMLKPFNREEIISTLQTAVEEIEASL